MKSEASRGTNDLSANNGTLLSEEEFLADWNFIRFDCAGMTWLMCNGELYQVYQ